MKKHLSFLQRCLVFLIDATTAFFLYHIAAWIISYFYFFPFFHGLLLIWVLYYIVGYWACGQTLGLAFFHARLADGGGRCPLGMRIVLREAFTSLPAIVLWTVGWHYLFIPLSLLICLLCCALAVFRKKVFKISFVRSDSYRLLSERLSGKRIIGAYLILMVVATAARVVNTVSTNSIDFLTNAFQYAAPRPTLHSVGKYVSFLEKDGCQNINDYVLGLFKTYDHVILCERNHQEMTQYDMIYNLVTDQRFVDSVGVLFTEVGNVDSRTAYKEFVNTPFPNDTTVEKGLASFLMENQTVHLLWPNTNWFHFLKKMYYFNHGRDKQVDILFADRNWLDRSLLDTRDSVMADNIIATIKADSLKKSLTIMNYRHAYLTPGNCGYYLKRAFPGKVANVMINSSSVSLPALLWGKEMPVLLQHGKWDVACEQVGDSAFAFDFAGSPFGKDVFDHFVLPWSPLNAKHYQDMFTGFIYYKPLSEQYISLGYNHMFDPENMEKLKERNSVLTGYSMRSWEYLRNGLHQQQGTAIYFEQARMDNMAYLAVCLLTIVIACVMLVV